MRRRQVDEVHLLTTRRTIERISARTAADIEALGARRDEPIDEASRDCIFQPALFEAAPFGIGATIVIGSNEQTTALSSCGRAACGVTHSAHGYFSADLHKSSITA